MNFKCRPGTDILFFFDFFLPDSENMLYWKQKSTSGGIPMAPNRPRGRQRNVLGYIARKAEEAAKKEAEKAAENAENKQE